MGKEKILIVEDENINSTLWASVLSNLLPNKEIQVFDNYESSLNYFSDNSSSVILILLDNDFFVSKSKRVVQYDLGIKLLGVVRKISQVPVIFCSTVCADKDFQEKIVDLDANYCFTKPLDVDKLKDALKELKLMK